MWSSAACCVSCLRAIVEVGRALRHSGFHQRDHAPRRVVEPVDGGAVEELDVRVVPRVGRGCVARVVDGRGREAARRIGEPGGASRVGGRRAPRGRVVRPRQHVDLPAGLRPLARVPEHAVGGLGCPGGEPALHGRPVGVVPRLGRVVGRDVLLLGGRGRRPRAVPHHGQRRPAPRSRDERRNGCVAGAALERERVLLRRAARRLGCSRRGGGYVVDLSLLLHRRRTPSIHRLN